MSPAGGDLVALHQDVAYVIELLEAQEALLDVFLSVAAAMGYVSGEAGVSRPLTPAYACVSGHLPHITEGGPVLGEGSVDGSG